MATLFEVTITCLLTLLFREVGQAKMCLKDECFNKYVIAFNLTKSSFPLPSKCVMRGRVGSYSTLICYLYTKLFPRYTFSLNSKALHCLPLYYCLDCMNLLFWLSRKKAFRSVLSFRPPLHFSPFDDVNSKKASTIWSSLLRSDSHWVK